MQSAGLYPLNSCAVPVCPPTPKYVFSGLVNRQVSARAAERHCNYGIIRCMPQRKHQRHQACALLLGAWVVPFCKVGGMHFATR